MDYETLDKIADAYTPLLLIIFLTGFCIRLKQAWPVYLLAATYMFRFLLLIAFSYGLMFLDNSLGIWPAIGLDYSTHTAVALALVICLVDVFPKARWLSIGSMFAYVGLMLYQQYHSLLDILSTGIIVWLFAIFIVRKHAVAPLQFARRS